MSPRRATIHQMFELDLGYDDHGQVSLTLRDRRRDLTANTVQKDISAGAIKPQPAQLHMFQEPRQPRAIQAKLPSLVVEFQAEAGLHQSKDAGTCPVAVEVGLWCQGPVRVASRIAR